MALEDTTVGAKARHMPAVARRVLSVVGAAIAGIFVAWSAWALPLQEAVRIGLERDPTISAYQMAVARETTNVEIAKDGRRPKLSLSGESSTADNDAAMVVTLTQVLIDWGLVKSQIATASYERVKVVAQLKMAVEDTTLDIADLYIQIEIVDRKIERTSDYVALATRIEKFSRDRVLAGLADSAEIARARLETARAEERMAQLVADRQIALTQLEFILGQPVQDLQPPPSLNFAKIFSTSSAVIKAVAIAPAYIEARTDVDIAAQAIKAAKAASKPKISLQAQGRQDLTGGRGRSGAIGITAGVDLNAGNLSGRATVAAKQEFGAAESRLLAVERDLQNSVRVYIEQLNVMTATEDSQQRQLAQAREVLAAYEQQFIGGRRELIDLLTTGRDMYEAEIAEIETYQERKQTEYDAAHAIGMLGSLLFATKK